MSGKYRKLIKSFDEFICEKPLQVQATQKKRKLDRKSLPHFVTGGLLQAETLDMVGRRAIVAQQQLATQPTHLTHVLK